MNNNNPEQVDEARLAVARQIAEKLVAHHLEVWQGLEKTIEHWTQLTLAILVNQETQPPSEVSNFKECIAEIYALAANVNPESAGAHLEEIADACKEWSKVIRSSSLQPPRSELGYDCMLSVLNRIGEIVGSQNAYSQFSGDELVAAIKKLASSSPLETPANFSFHLAHILDICYFNPSIESHGCMPDETGRCMIAACACKCHFAPAPADTGADNCQKCDGNAKDNAVLAEISELVMGYREASTGDILDRVRHLVTIEPVASTGDTPQPQERKSQESFNECSDAAVELLAIIENGEAEDGCAAVFELRKLLPNLDKYVTYEVEDRLEKAAVATCPICNAPVELNPAALGKTPDALRPTFEDQYIGDWNAPYREHVAEKWLIANGCPGPSKTLIELLANFMKYAATLPAREAKEK